MNGPTRNAQPLRVLSLEDSPADAELVRRILSQAGYELEMDVATGRARFEELLADGHYDVILADFSLPGFDAPQALELAKSAGADTPFICVSGVIGEEATVDLLKQGADDCVLKERLARLPFAVQRAVEERSHARELREAEARYRSYVAEAPYGVFVTDAQGDYVEVNRAAAEQTGYSQSELAQMNIIALLAPDAIDAGRLEFAHLVETGASSGHVVLVRKDGSSLPVRLDAVRLSATRYLGFTVDVSEQQRAEDEVIADAAQLERVLTATIAALGATTELRDPYTAGHQRRVAQLAGDIAVELGWSDERITSVRTAGQLHDIGKIVVPAEILSKPGRLTEVEMELVRQHAAASAALIAGIEFGSPVAAIVNQHHERLDGSGYPAGLVGAQILAEARVLAVADVVEAMFSHRPYRAALGIEPALAEIRENAGIKYDAEVGAACESIFAAGFVFSE
jgi:PAS domain S-box-containing protein